MIQSSTELKIPMDISNTSGSQVSETPPFSEGSGDGMKKRGLADFEKIDGEIRKGDFSSAQTLLKLINLKRLSRAEVFRAASLAYRAGLPYLALRCMSPYIHPDERIMAKPSSGEVAEYAVALIKIGATNEALKWLDTVDAGHFPLALKQSAFVDMSRWQYSEALKKFELYLSRADANDYDSIVVKVNLAACYAYEGQVAQAVEVLEQLISPLAQQQRHLLLGNCYEIRAQCFLYQGNYSQAQSDLELAHTYLSRNTGENSLFVDKWRLALQLHRHGWSHSSESEIEQLRRSASVCGHWETVRECDFFKAIFSKNRLLAVKLYFGTPFEGYRKRLIKKYGEPLALPADYVFSGTTSGPIRVFDLLTGAESEAVCLRSGMSLHRMVRGLLSDFYRPARLGFLHGKIFDSEYFDPLSSPHKISQLVGRLRQWFREAKIPCQLEVKEGAPRLQITGDYGFRTYIKYTMERPKDYLLDRLEKVLDGRELSSSQMAKELGVSKRLVNRALTDDEGQRFLVTGSGRMTRYRLKGAA